MELITEKGVRGTGRFENATTIDVNFPFAAGLRGSILDNGQRIQWSNGESWFRSVQSSASGALVTSAQGISARFAGTWVAPFNGGEAIITHHP
jgi:hypothetical protein